MGGHAAAVVAACRCVVVCQHLAALFPRSLTSQGRARAGALTLWGCSVLFYVVMRRAAAGLLGQGGCARGDRMGTETAAVRRV